MSTETIDQSRSTATGVMDGPGWGYATAFQRETGCSRETAEDWTTNVWRGAHRLGHPKLNIADCPGCKFELQSISKVSGTGPTGGQRPPRLLDLFCKEGGASRGYAGAGFEVVGVDINPQPRYPYEFIQADALEVLADQDFLRTFDALAGSPPCQAHSALAASNPHTYADFIPQTRATFRASGLPYVIENVVGAPLVDPVLLCGSMFDLGAGGYQLLRHRLFETNVPVMAPPCRHDSRPVIGVYGNKARCRRRGNGIPAMGTNLPKQLGEQAMGIDWMTINGLSEAIPPAYSRFMGGQLLAHLGLEVSA